MRQGEEDIDVDVVAADEDMDLETIIRIDRLGIDSVCELIIDEYRCSKPFGFTNVSSAKDANQSKAHQIPHRYRDSQQSLSRSR